MYRYQNIYRSAYLPLDYSPTLANPTTYLLRRQLHEPKPEIIFSQEMYYVLLIAFRAPAISYNQNIVQKNEDRWRLLVPFLIYPSLSQGSKIQNGCLMRRWYFTREIQPVMNRPNVCEPLMCFLQTCLGADLLFGVCEAWWGLQFCGGPSLKYKTLSCCQLKSLFVLSILISIRKLFTLSFY